MNVVKRYQHNGLNAKINPMLRGERPHNKQYNKNIQNLNALMTPGNRNETLFRGLMLKNVPNTLKSKAFTSASSNRAIAKTFAQNGKKRGILIGFTLPKNIKRYHIKNAHNYESETLIQRNTQFTNFKFIGTNNGVRVYSAKIEHLSVPRVIRLQLNSNNESSNFEN
jgi:hypothetical protein